MPFKEGDWVYIDNFDNFRGDWNPGTNKLMYAHKELGIAYQIESINRGFIYLEGQTHTYVPSWLSYENPKDKSSFSKVELKIRQLNKKQKDRGYAY